MFKHKGNILVDDARLGEAIEAYRRSLVLQPDQNDVRSSLNAALAARLELSQACSSGTTLDAVDSCVAALLPGEDDERRIREKIGDLFFAGDALDQALLAYQGAQRAGGSASVSGKVKAIAQMRSCRAASGERAVSVCRSAIDLMPTSPSFRKLTAELYAARGSALLDDGSLASAIADFRAALQMDGRNDGARTGLDRAELARERLALRCEARAGDEALRACTAALLPGEDDEFAIRLRICELHDAAGDVTSRESSCAEARTAARSAEERSAFDLVMADAGKPEPDPAAIPPPPPPRPDPYQEQKGLCVTGRDGDDVEAAIEACQLARTMSPNDAESSELDGIISELQFRRQEGICLTLAGSDDLAAARNACREALAKATGR